MRQIVVVLHADDLADPAPFRDLRGRHVAEPDMADQALPLQLGEHGERRLDRALGWAMHVEHAAQVDDVEHVEAEVAQIVVDGLRQLFARKGRDPGPVLAAPGADLGDDDEIVGIGMQRLADDLVGDMRAVEVAGVDVVDAAGHRLAQHGERRVAILGRAEDAGPGELHGAVTQPLHGAVAEREGAGLCRCWT